MSGELRFRPGQPGFSSILGELERPIMEVLWRSPGSTVAEVVTALPAPAPAYTTVKTVMDRLVKKGYLTRTPTPGRAFCYQAAVTRDTLEGRASRRVIEGLMNAFGAAALSQFAQLVREDPQRLAELRALLDEEDGGQ